MRGTQERKFSFVKKVFHIHINGDTQEKIHPHTKPSQRAGGC